MQSAIPPASTSQKARRRAFTLIELLIVVAIIAILAAIAVPNFLQAQVRSKVSRCLSDLRVMRTAAESYAVDNNRYPRSSWGCPPFNDQLYGEGVWGTLTDRITTPISYMTTIPFDVFSVNITEKVTDKLYAYGSYDSTLYYMDVITKGGFGPCPVPGSPGFIYVFGTRKTAQKINQYMGSYYLWSVGPAGLQMTSTGTVDEYFLQYDPTNGTVSTGRIFVSQKFSEPTYIPHANFF